MTNKNLTEIICIIDRSSSMLRTQQEVIDGFNNFIKGQKEEEGIAKITLALFDTNYDALLEGKPLIEISPNFLSKENYQPSGCTALLDAIGSTIDNVGNRLKMMEEDDRPSKVIFLIMTDGQENSSQKYQASAVKEMVQRQQSEYNWEFCFIGANIDSFAVGNSFGIDSGSIANYTADAVGTNDLYSRIGSTVSKYRSSGKVDTATLRGNNKKS